MFTVQDLAVGDLVASMHLTVTEIQALPGKLGNQTLINIKGVDWSDGHSVDIVTVASTECEVWE